MATRKERMEKLTRHMGSDGAHAAILTLEAIEALILVDGRPPSYREVAELRQLTVPGIQHQAAFLVKAGLLEMSKSARSFRVLDTAEKGGWHEAGKTTLSRSETTHSSDISDAVEAFVVETMDRVDMFGSDIEIIIRHRP